jgi:feruloyl-CoA synthase
MCTGRAGAWAGFIGFPVPGLELKLVAAGDKLEARVRGPNVTPGYFRDEARTRAAFDEEGFYALGDAVKYVDPADPARGLLFDGRLDEDFKLSSGTWVRVGPLRARILAHADGRLRDAVIAGHDAAFVSALLFPDLEACRELCPDLPRHTPARAVLDHPAVRERIRATLAAVAAESTGTSTFVARALLLDVPPSIDAQEVTDKGSLNQKAVLAHRSAWVEELYAPSPSPRTIHVEN